MDLRSHVLCILVGGAPAPGVNAVIMAVVKEGLDQDMQVIGIKFGLEYIKQGISRGVIHRFAYSDLRGLYSRGGSFLHASKDQFQNAQEVDNAIRVLEHLRVRYLVTIGGTVTASSAHLLAAAAKKANLNMSVVHVPKTVFNDLPLPLGAGTFGFSTARDEGVRIVHNLKTDAHTMGRFYIIVIIGQQAGHLALGIGKGATTSLTIIPEDFRGKRVVRFAELCDLVDSCVIKRRAKGKNYGTMVLTEGLVDLMDESECSEIFGDVDSGHQELGRTVAVELRRRWAERSVASNFVSRNLGNELRSADPSPYDSDLARELGYGAFHLLLNGESGVMVTQKAGEIHPINLQDIMDPSSSTRSVIRYVDTRGLNFEVARKHMAFIRSSDLLDRNFIRSALAACNNAFTEAAFLERFEPIVSFFDSSQQPTDST